LLGAPPQHVVVVEQSSLVLMHDCAVWALLFALCILVRAVEIERDAPLGN